MMGVAGDFRPRFAAIRLMIGAVIQATNAVPGRRENIKPMRRLGTTIEIFLTLVPRWRNAVRELALKEMNGGAPRRRMTVPPMSMERIAENVFARSTTDVVGGGAPRTGAEIEATLLRFGPDFITTTRLGVEAICGPTATLPRTMMDGGTRTRDGEPLQAMTLEGGTGESTDGEDVPFKNVAGRKDGFGAGVVRMGAFRRTRGGLLRTGPVARMRMAGGARTRRTPRP